MRHVSRPPASRRRSRLSRPTRSLTSSSQPLTLNVDAKTRYVKADQPSTLDALALNDQVVVKAKASRCDLLTSGTSPPALTAKMVVVQTPDA